MKYKKIERKEIVEIRKILTISNAHIMEQTAMKLEEAVEKMESNMGLCVYEKKEYGFFVQIPDIWGKEYNIPVDLAECINLAHDNGCEWLCLDRDGESLRELPVYEWS